MCVSSTSDTGVIIAVMVLFLALPRSFALKCPENTHRPTVCEGRTTVLLTESDIDGGMVV